MDYPKFIISKRKEDSISIQRVNGFNHARTDGQSNTLITMISAICWTEDRSSENKL